MHCALGYHLADERFREELLGTSDLANLQFRDWY
jgi:hypothetical protein